MTTTDNAATIARLSAELDAIRVAYYAPDMSVLDGCRFTAEQTGKYVTMTTAFGRDGSIVGRDSNGAEGIAQGVWWKRLQTVEHALSVARNGGQPTAILRTPSSQSAEGMVIAALERGIDVEARLARWNEDELSEDDDI